MNKYITMVISLALIIIPILVLLKISPPIIKALILFTCGIIGILVLVVMFTAGIVMLWIAIKQIFNL